MTTLYTDGAGKQPQATATTACLLLTRALLACWYSGKYPSDAFIMDFGWFTHVSDYSFPPKGFSDYHDFGYNNVTLPDPVTQLKSYRNDLHYRFGGIRKPRLGNTELLNEARSLGLMLPGGEGGGSLNAHAYAFKRNLNFSHPPTREWYNAKMAHYLDDGKQASKQHTANSTHPSPLPPSPPFNRSRLLVE